MALILLKRTIHFTSDNYSGLILVITFVLAIISIPLSMSVYLSWNFANMSRELKRNLAQVQELSARSLEQELEKEKNPGAAK